MFKFSLATLSYVVVTMVLGIFWSLVIFRDTYVELTKNAYRSAPIIPLGMSAMLIEGLALSALFYIFYIEERSLRKGVLLGLLAGGGSMTYASLVVPAKFTISSISSISSIWQYLSLEILFGVLHYSVTGLIFALIFRKTATKI